MLIYFWHLPKIIDKSRELNTISGIALQQTGYIQIMSVQCWAGIAVHQYTNIVLM